MAAVIPAVERRTAPESDYGSDFSVEEQHIVIQLLEDIQNAQEQDGSPSDTRIGTELQEDLDAAIAAGIFATEALEDLDSDNQDASAAEHVDPDFGGHPSGSVKVTASFPGNRTSSFVEDDLQVRSLPVDGISYPDLSRALSDLKSRPLPVAAAGTSPAKVDNRSPVERFRTYPRRPLTVTDISSGAWCELQYWYTLSLLPGGKKTRTAAMRGGTKVHQTLEDQVHTTVQVTVSLKEEAFALRLWNFIQGLRTLRSTGLTRELEIWGTVEGQVINGVIDELSYTSPDLGFEQELSQSPSSRDGRSNPTENQPSITDYLDPLRRRIYLTDVKTRGSTRLPSGAALRPSRVQLFLYHRLLGDMAAGRLDFPQIVSRYGLQQEARFSDAFMAQIGSLHDEVFDETEDDDMRPEVPAQISNGLDHTYPGAFPNGGGESSPPPDLIKYRSIAQILPLVQAELSETFPQGADTLGDVVTIVYRHRDDGRIIGNHIFATDHEALSNYLKLNLAWWLGRRSPEGVPIEEAYKCRICEFAESCEWRKEREDEIVRRSRVQTSERTHALGGE